MTEGIPPGRVINDADARDLSRLLRAPRKWPRSSRAAEQRDELAAFLIELHPIPHGLGSRKAYPISRDQSAGATGTAPFPLTSRLDLPRLSLIVERTLVPLWPTHLR